MVEVSVSVTCFCRWLWGTWLFLSLLPWQALALGGVVSCRTSCLSSPSPNQAGSQSGNCKEAVFKVAESEPCLGGFGTELTSSGISEFNNEPEDHEKKVCWLPTPRSWRGFWPQLCSHFKNSSLLLFCQSGRGMNKSWSPWEAQRLPSRCESSGGALSVCRRCSLPPALTWHSLGTWRLGGAHWMVSLLGEYVEGQPLLEAVPLTKPQLREKGKEGRPRGRLSRLFCSQQVSCDGGRGLWGCAAPRVKLFFAWSSVCVIPFRSYSALPFSNPYCLS